MIVVIKGIPGSGKTYIAEILKKRGIPVVDTDDLISAAYNELKDTPKFKAASARKPPKGGKKHPAYQMCVDLAVKRLEVWCAPNKPHDRLAVVVGVTLYVPFDIGYFIRMDKSMLETAYRRTITREYQKFFDNERAIKQSLARADLNTLQFIGLSSHIGALDLNTSFSVYCGMYSGALKFERKNKLIALAQDDIITEVVGFSLMRTRSAKSVI